RFPLLEQARHPRRIGHAVVRRDHQGVRVGVCHWSQSLAGSGFASLMLSGSSPTLNVPAPAFVTSTSAPAASTYRFPITLPSANFSLSSASTAASAPSSSIGTPPARRSSRPSPVLTTMTSVSHTWLFSRVPVLIIRLSLPLSVSLAGLPASQFVNQVAAQHLSSRCGR